MVGRAHVGLTAAMGLTTAQRAVIAIGVGFAIPLIGWALPGERGPDTLPGALAQGAVFSVLLLVVRMMRGGARSKARDAGRDLRARREGADSAD
jgi:hypothetical protein